jgi:hypothetical protein
MEQSRERKSEQQAYELAIGDQGKFYVVGSPVYSTSIGLCDDKSFGFSSIIQSRSPRNTTGPTLG